MKEELIYFDNNATTPLDPRVLEAMMPYLTNQYGNSASNHAFGHQAKEMVKSAREQIASLINSEAHEIVFTSGATESINLAIKGVADSYQVKGKHIITVLTEHSAVLDVCEYLELKGYDITYLEVDQFGLIDLGELQEAIRPNTVLVSVMMVNNETGVIQPIKEIAEIAHQAEALFMTDATQAFGKMPIDVDELGIDLMAFSGHKIYGPKGAGGLFVRQRRPTRIKLTPIIHGGGHEKGMRSGTSNVPGIIGLGEAARIAQEQMFADKDSVGLFRDRLESELLNIPDVSLNGHPEQRLYNVSSLCFKGADADAIMIGLKSIMVSNGSACTSTKIEPSHVLTAMGLSEPDSYSTIRFSLGRFTSLSDIDQAIAIVPKVVTELRKMVS